MKTILLIDGDEFLFKASIAVERPIKWDDQNWVLYANENEAWDNARRMFLQTEERLGADSIIVCFGGERPYFREDLYPSYKGGRPGRKPMCYAQLKAWVEQSYTTKEYPHIEADDCLGILGTKPPQAGVGRFIMCSQDKDMKTVPGWHYDGKGNEPEYIPAQQAEMNHFLQTLTGDRTDNYPGCPGMGPARAEYWLCAVPHASETQEWSWDRVVAAYKKAGLGEADALVQARLARILQWADWDRERKEPILWTPMS